MKLFSPTKSNKKLDLFLFPKEKLLLNQQSIEIESILKQLGLSWGNLLIKTWKNTLRIFLKFKLGIKIGESDLSEVEKWESCGSNVDQM